MTPADQIYSLPTTVGAAKLAYAMANQLTVDISHMAIGDGNGVAVNPTAAWSALAREVLRPQLNQLYQHPTNPNWLVAEVVLPAEVGGWTIREIGLYDVAGDLIFIGNHAEQYKPVQSQGSDETKTIRMVILVSSTAAVTLKTDPTTVMASIDYVQRELAKLDAKQSVRYTTTAAIGLAGLAVQAGGDWAGALTTGDRVLVKNQAAGKDNGIYAAAAGAWLRVADADGSVEVTSGLVVAVEQGATLADTRWQLVTDGAIVLGTTALVFQNVTQGFAPLNSPGFTGSPSAPTPARSDQSGRIATMAAVRHAMGNSAGVLASGGNLILTSANAGALVIGNAAGTITLPLGSTLESGDTFVFQTNIAGVVLQTQGPDLVLNGVIAGLSTVPLGDGDSLSLTWMTAYGYVPTGGSEQLRYAPIMAGANWTTPPQFASDKKLSTTEFVKRQGMQASGMTAFNADTTLTAAHVGGIVYAYGTSAKAFTLPLMSAIPAGGRIEIVNSSSGVLTVQRQGTDLINRQTLQVTSFTVEMGASVVLVNNAISGSWFITSGLTEAQFLPSFGSSLAANGYKKTPDSSSPTGFIIRQWGLATSSASAAVAVTLPTTFPTALVSLSAICSATGAYLATINTPTLSSFQLSAWIANTAARVATPVFWVAEGY